MMRKKEIPEDLFPRGCLLQICRKYVCTLHMPYIKINIVTFSYIVTKQIGLINTALPRIEPIKNWNDKTIALCEWNLFNSLHSIQLKGK